MVEKKWLVITVIGWLLIVAFSYKIQVPTLSLKLTWMALQQLWLVFGGLKTIKDRQLISLDTQQLLAGFKAGLVLFVLNSILTYLVIWFLSVVYGSSRVLIWLGEERVGMEQLFAVADAKLLIVVFFLIVIGAPISEEIIFRGGLLLAFSEVTSLWVANLISALIFALVHYYFVQFVPIFFSGLFLGRLFVSKKNLTKPIVAHATVNLIGFLFYLYG